MRRLIGDFREYCVPSQGAPGSGVEACLVRTMVRSSHFHHLCEICVHNNVSLRLAVIVDEANLELSILMHRPSIVDVFFALHQSDSAVGVSDCSRGAALQEGLSMDPGLCEQPQETFGFKIDVM